MNGMLLAGGLRSTAQRRRVLAALTDGQSRTPAEIHAAAPDVNLVTVYRVLEQCLGKGLVHQHPCNGAYSLCTMYGIEGHHAFLHCKSCGGVEEFANPDLCRSEDRIARSKGFVPQNHVSEILGTCARCIAA